MHALTFTYVQINEGFAWGETAGDGITEQVHVFHACIYTYVCVYVYIRMYVCDGGITEQVHVFHAYI